VHPTVANNSKHSRNRPHTHHPASSSTPPLPDSRSSNSKSNNQQQTNTNTTPTKHSNHQPSAIQPCDPRIIPSTLRPASRQRCKRHAGLPFCPSSLPIPCLLSPGQSGLSSPSPLLDPPSNSIYAVSGRPLTLSVCYSKVLYLAILSHAREAQASRF
jgi:hypothetical protein